MKSCEYQFAVPEESHLGLYRCGVESLFWCAMWYVDKHFEQSQVRVPFHEGLYGAQFGRVVRIEKYNCGAELRKSPQGSYQMTIIPSIVVRGQSRGSGMPGTPKFLLTFMRGKSSPSLSIS